MHSSSLCHLNNIYFERQLPTYTLCGKNSIDVNAEATTVTKQPLNVAQVLSDEDRAISGSVIGGAVSSEGPCSRQGNMYCNSTHNYKSINCCESLFHVHEYGTYICMF